ncbi:uncharacterized protein [Montipora foliosa]|uniref:uncharacterized protein n=1 Tax=Montipora foliosa TaxID=591990 RepID=UPI0035F1ED55
MIYRRDRVGRVGGGVLLAIKNTIPSQRRSDLKTEMEMVCVELNLTDASKILVSVIYRPPNSETEFHDHITAFLRNCTRITKSHTIIMGDFNFPGIKRIENCGFVNSQNSTEAIFCEAVVDHCFLQLNTLPTHFSAQRSNVLDLVITNAPQCIKDIARISPDEAGLSTDHHLVQFDILGHHRRIKKPERYVYKFKGADLELLKNDLKQSTIITESLSGSDVNNCWLKWKSAVLNIIDSHIPKIKLKNVNTPPWIDKEVLHLLKKKETSRRTAKRLNGEHHFEKFRELRRASKKLINKKVKEYNESLGKSVKENPKRFWSHFRHKTKSN